MDPRPFFKSAQNTAEQDENLKQTVRFAVDEFLQNEKNPNAKLKSFFWILDIKRVGGLVSLTGLAKMLSSAFIWAVYHEIKSSLRETEINEIYLKLENGEITFKQALAQILSGIGKNDLDSFKYKLLKELFGFNAKSHDEAKKLVQLTIEILQGNDQELEMGPASTASSRRLSGSGE